MNRKASLLLVFPLLLCGVWGCDSSPAVSESSIRSALQSEVKSEMTTAEVEALLGAGRVPSEMESMVLKSSMESPSDPSMAPDGFQPGDTFVAYSLGEVSCFVQYRNGVLVKSTPSYTDLSYCIQWHG